MKYKINYTYNRSPPNKYGYTQLPKGGRIFSKKNQ